MDEEQRKIRKCPYCKEYFNTTREMMLVHYLKYHVVEFNPITRLLLEFEILSYEYGRWII